MTLLEYLNRGCKQKQKLTRVVCDDIPTNGTNQIQTRNYQGFIFGLGFQKQHYELNIKIYFPILKILLADQLNYTKPVKGVHLFTDEALRPVIAVAAETNQKNHEHDYWVSRDAC